MDELLAMKLTRAIWSVVNVPPMLAIACLGMIASLLAWDWLNDKCWVWYTSINSTRP